MQQNDLVVLFGQNPRQMAKELCEACDLAADIGSTNARIGLKPNLVVAKPADSGATTHPEILAGIIEYLQERGFCNITILEGSWVGDRTAQAFRTCGYHDLSNRYGVPLVDTQLDSYHPVDCKGMTIQVCNALLKIDYLINLPVLKGHCQTAMTCALKNAKGLISNAEKRKFHAMGLHKPIAHLNCGIRNGLILVDGLCGDLNFEEGGNPVQMNRMIAAKDPVLCDAYVCELMGFTLAEVPYIQLAERLGAGCADTAKANLRFLNDDKQNGKKLQFSRKIERLSRFTEQDDACSACYGSLIHALDRLDEAGKLDGLRKKVCIGQGFQGKTGTLGVGRCTGGFAQSVPGCPPKAIDILHFLEQNLG